MDSIYKNEDIKSQGLLIGEFELREDSTQFHSGLFRGMMTLYWYVDRDSVIHLDCIENYSDRYRNNQYIGTWIQFGTIETKVTNWGEKRIPFSKDLDLGVGEFTPNPKYTDKGWSDFLSE